MKSKFNLYDVQKSQMKELKAGNTCGCSCWAANSGGSATYTNGCANRENNLWSNRGECIIFVAPPTEFGN